MAVDKTNEQANRPSALADKSLNRDASGHVMQVPGKRHFDLKSVLEFRSVLGLKTRFRLGNNFSIT